MFTCHVCGYQELRRPHGAFLAVAACRTEFGYDDARRTNEELRGAWLRRGASWFSQAVATPAHWNAYTQLQDAGLLHQGQVIAQTIFFQPIWSQQIRIHLANVAVSSSTGPHQQPTLRIGHYARRVPIDSELELQLR